MIGGTVTQRSVPLDHPGLACDLQSVLELAPLASAVPCARLHAVNVLHEWGLPGLAEDCALIVSELITNAAEAAAVLPGRPPVVLRLLASQSALVIEAWDQSPVDLSPRQLAPREADAEAECGRGLTVVAALATRWGSERTGPRRKVVWAELAR